ALATNAGDGDLNAAAIAHDILVFDALVFSAGALVVAHRAENLLAEQTTRLGLEGAVIDRLRILHLALRPFADGLGGGDADGNAVKGGLFEAEGGTGFVAGGGGGVGRLDHLVVSLIL